MKRAYLFVRNLKSVDLSKYDKIYYSTSITNELFENDQIDNKTLEYITTGAHRVDFVLKIIKDLEQYYGRPITPISLGSLSKTLDLEQIGQLVVELPLGEHFNVKDERIKLIQKSYEVKLTNFTKYYQSLEDINFTEIFKPKTKSEHDLYNLLKNFKDELYESQRKKIKGNTSKISPYVALGVINFEQLMNWSKNLNSEFRRQIAWIYYCKLKDPTGWVFKPIKNKKFFEWAEGSLEGNCETVKFVNKQMKILNQGGHLSNRTRLIVAAYLIRDLGIDWHYGELYFRHKLIDSHPSINRYNWYAQSKNRFLKNYNIPRQLKLYDI